MKTSNKILIAAILLVVIPAIATLLSVISRTNQTIEMINSINIDSITVVDARNTNLVLAPNEDAFSRMGAIWIENGSIYLQCTRYKRHGFDSFVEKIPWRGKWQPTPVFLLGNPIDRGAWWATIHGVAKSWTQLGT